MSEANTGGCASGAIRFEIAGEPMFVTQTGAAKLRDMIRDSGNVKTRLPDLPIKADRQSRTRC